MNYLIEYKNYSKVLLIVDVQKSFSKFFTENYLKSLKEHCENFPEVYQIFDNHVDGKNVDKDYLYDDDPDIPIHHDLYFFPNQVEQIEKRYNYDVDVDFYKKILDKETYDIIKNKQDNGTLNRGDMFKTTLGTAITYIGNNHKWFHLPKRLYEIFLKLKKKPIEIVGGSDNECLEDVFITANSMGLNIYKNKNFIYSAKNCPMK